MMERVNTRVLVVCMTTMIACIQGCSDTAVTSCQEVDPSECKAAMSAPHSQPHGYQLHADMAASFVNLTVMVDTASHANAHNGRTLRLVLDNWLGQEPIKLKEMFILMASSEEATHWSTCLKITLTTGMTTDKETSLSALLPTHQNISSYRMTIVSTFQDSNGQLAVGHTTYFLKMSDFASNKDWILPVIAYTNIGDGVVFSMTPPAPRIHRNFLNCSTWLIACGSDPDRMLGPLEGNEPDVAYESDMEEADEWGMGSCMYYENEVLLKSSMKFPIVNMKVLNGKYQIWIDCVLQNPLTPWPSTTKTIRTPTFTHPGTDEFYINVYWKDGGKRNGLGANFQQYSKHTEYRQHLKSDTPLVDPSRAPTDNDVGNNVILVACLASIALLLVGIGTVALYKAREHRKRHIVLKENSSNSETKTSTLEQSPPTQSRHSYTTINSSHNGKVSIGGSSLDFEDERDSQNNSFVTTTHTPPLHGYKRTPVYNITTSYSSNLNMQCKREHGSDGSSDCFRSEDDNEMEEEEVEYDFNRKNTEVIPLQFSKPYSLTKPLVIHDADRYSTPLQSNGVNQRDTQCERLKETLYLSSNDNSSSLGYHSYTQQLPPIVQPKTLAPDMRADSVNFDDLLRSFNSSATDWCLKGGLDGKVDSVCVTDHRVSIRKPVLW